MVRFSYRNIFRPVSKTRGSKFLVETLRTLYNHVLFKIGPPYWRLSVLFKIGPPYWRLPVFFKIDPSYYRPHVLSKVSCLMLKQDMLSCYNICTLHTISSQNLDKVLHFLRRAFRNKKLNIFQWVFTTAKVGHWTVGLVDCHRRIGIHTAAVAFGIFILKVRHWTVGSVDCHRRIGILQ